MLRWGTTFQEPQIPSSWPAKMQVHLSSPCKCWHSSGLVSSSLQLTASYHSLLKMQQEKMIKRFIFNESHEYFSFYLKREKSFQAMLEILFQQEAQQVFLTGMLSRHMEPLFLCKVFLDHERPTHTLICMPMFCPELFHHIICLLSPSILSMLFRAISFPMREWSFLWHFLRIGMKVILSMFTCCATSPVVFVHPAPTATIEEAIHSCFSLQWDKKMKKYHCKNCLDHHLHTSKTEWRRNCHKTCVRWLYHTLSGIWDLERG